MLLRQTSVNMDFKEVKILVNGKELELNKFAMSVCGNTVYGMVSSLVQVHLLHQGYHPDIS